VKVLFDHNVDRRFRRHLPAHEIKTAREMRWEQLDNGELVDAAAVEGFEVVLSVDKNLRHQQNLQTLPIPIVVLDSVSNALPDLVPGCPCFNCFGGRSIACCT
jgi:hypothetical protein